MAEGEKTEQATPKKRRDERKKGNIFFSNDAVSVVVMLVGFFVLNLCSLWIVETTYGFLKYCMELAQAPLQSASGINEGLFVEFLFAFGKAALPVMAAVALAGIAATFAQTQMLVTGESLKPKFNRLNPLQGFKNLFSARSLVDALKNLFKISILLILIFQYVKNLVDIFLKYLHTDLTAACAHLFENCFMLSMQIGVAFTVLAGFDIFYQWWQYEKNLRMSKEEIKEEYKQMEGDPKVKGKIKELQRKMAQSRMMQQVPQADVVVRNPTHFAVALRYRPEIDGAPVVLAKGQDELALRIVRIAEENKITVVENVPLARALYATTELNQEIPPELYNAVAEVMVYLYKINQTQR